MDSKYDVVLSFKGEDTRERFISHLHAALDRKKIETYIDYRLERGDEISPVFLKAIQESKLSLIVFSKNYSSSSWCLDELLHIMDCKKRIGQIVVPVFYRIKPSHVRKQKGSIAAGLSRLEERFDEDKMSLWRAALTEAANLSGFDSKKIRPESELVEAIIKDVLKKLNYASSSDLKGLIGIEERIKKVESLLCINGSENVRIVGIWGMGGIGKTTLSDVVFNRLSSQFESCYFLSNVEEKAKKYVKPDYFQEKLLSVLLEDENSKKGLPSIRSTFVQERLRRKKVLVVLDDMKDNQIELLSRAHDLFGHGSRIIVTTRDVQVLRSIGADEIYEVEELYWDEAFKLFCQCAFRNDSPTSRDFIDLSKEMVSYTNGNPLALKVLGSFLCCRTKEQWQSALDELKTVPNKEIHNVLKMSYDGLNENQKEIFLDIACFFKDQDKDHVQNILDGCGFSAEIGFQVLVDKSLITIVNKTVKMHNLLQEMGREIVRHKSIKEPEKHSRLWIAKDIYHVLKNGLGTKAIEGMFLDMSKGRDQLQLRSSSFKKLYNLRLLKVYNNYDLTYPEKCKVTLPKGLLSIPDALRYFHWEAYPLKSLPPRFSPYNLVELNMPHSQVEQLWDGIQELENLKHIDLSWSTQLTQIPNLSLAPNLEGVKLEGCICLNEVPSYFQNFDKLSSLNLRSCSNLKNLPEIPQSIEWLDLSEIEIQELPSSIWSLHKLHTFHLDGYKYIKDIPSDASMLNSLNSLSLQNCTSLTEFHELPRNISKLDLSNTAIEVIPSSIQCLSSLVYLYLTDCKMLKSLPTSICKLKSLKTIFLMRCSQLESFPEILEPMESLEDLWLDGTAIKRLHSSIECLIELQYLSLDSCKNLEFVPNRICHLFKLGWLSFAGCSKLERLPPLYCYRPYSLPLQLYMSDRDDFRTDWLLSLTTLDLSGTNVERVPKSIENVSYLNVLALSNCKRLKSLPKLPFVLRVLYADDCTSLETVSSSRTELIRDWEDLLWDGREEEGLKFFNCLNLDQTAKRNIMADAELRIWRKAALAKEYFSKNESYVFEEPSVCVCYPGSEIPKWFMYQTAGPSVNIKLPLHWFNDNNFLGFAICIVANFDGDDDKDKDENMENSYLKCGIHFKTSCGESHRFDCFLKVWGDTRKVISDHVFQWYDYDLYDGVKSIWYTTSLNNEDITEVEFYLYPHVYYGDEHVCCCTVKNCGIRLLYVEDGEKAILEEQEEEEEEEEDDEDDDDDDDEEEEEDINIFEFFNRDAFDDDDDVFEFLSRTVIDNFDSEEEDDEDESEFHQSLIFCSTEEEGEDEKDGFELNGSIIGSYTEEEEDNEDDECERRIRRRRRRRTNLFVSSEEEEEEECELRIRRRRRTTTTTATAPNLFVSSEEEEEEDGEDEPHPKRVKEEDDDWALRFKRRRRRRTTTANLFVSSEEEEEEENECELRIRRRKTTTTAATNLFVSSEEEEEEGDCDDEPHPKRVKRESNFQ